jgi:hypothetical protein
MKPQRFRHSLLTSFMKLTTWSGSRIDPVVWYSRMAVSEAKRMRSILNLYSVSQDSHSAVEARIKIRSALNMDPVIQYSPLPVGGAK